MASWTVACVSSATSRLPDNTCETVVGLTPASAATWVIVTRVCSGVRDPLPSARRPPAPAPVRVLGCLAAMSSPFCVRARVGTPPLRVALGGLRVRHGIDRPDGPSYGSEKSPSKSIWGTGVPPAPRKGPRVWADVERFDIDDLLAAEHAGASTSRTRPFAIQV